MYPGPAVFIQSKNINIVFAAAKMHWSNMIDDVLLVASDCTDDWLTVCGYELNRQPVRPMRIARFELSSSTSWRGKAAIMSSLDGKRIVPKSNRFILQRIGGNICMLTLEVVQWTIWQRPQWVTVSDQSIHVQVFPPILLHSSFTIIIGGKYAASMADDRGNLSNQKNPSNGGKFGITHDNTKRILPAIIAARRAEISDREAL